LAEMDCEPRELLTHAYCGDTYVGHCMLGDIDQW
jgi:hypothetical protein